jgi:hypothetical protein
MGNTKTTDFKTAAYFAPSVTFFGAILACLGLFIISSSSMITGLVLFFISTLIFTTHYRLRIDPVNKTFHDYLWVLGFKKGTKGQYRNIDYLFITQNKVSQAMHAQIASSTFQREIFDGYIRFSEDNKIHIGTNDDKVELTTHLKQIAQQLDTKLIDYTTGTPQEI